MHTNGWNDTKLTNSYSVISLKAADNFERVEFFQVFFLFWQ